MNKDGIKVDLVENHRAKNIFDDGGLIFPIIQWGLDDKLFEWMLWNPCFANLAANRWGKTKLNPISQNRSL